MRRLKLGQFTIKVILHAGRLLVGNYHDCTINGDLHPGNHYAGSSDASDGSREVGLGETGTVSWHQVGISWQRLCPPFYLNPFFGLWCTQRSF
jgi:hypothetical protein